MNSKHRAQGKVSQPPSPPSFHCLRLHFVPLTYQPDSPLAVWWASGRLLQSFRVKPCEQWLRRNGGYAGMSLWGSNKQSWGGEGPYENKTKPNHQHLRISFFSSLHHFVKGTCLSSQSSPKLWSGENFFLFKAVIRERNWWFVEEERKKKEAKRRKKVRKDKSRWSRRLIS